MIQEYLQYLQEGYLFSDKTISIDLDTDFYDNFGIVKTQNNKVYYYGGTDSVSNVSDNLYSIIFDDGGDLIVATEKEDLFFSKCSLVSRYHSRCYRMGNPCQCGN